jgi:hypothetical protein
MNSFHATILNTLENVLMCSALDCNTIFFFFAGKFCVCAVLREDCKVGFRDHNIRFAELLALAF